MIFFFFSSRRRHTRFDCDWSSDVCSSDLLLGSLPLSSFGGLSPSSRGGSTREADRLDHSAKGDFVRLRQAEMLLEELEIDQGPEQLFVVLPALFMFGEQLLNFMAIAYLGRQRMRAGN